MTMDHTLNRELSLDPTSHDAPPQYHKVLHYLMEHQDVMEEEKLGVEFCDLSSKRLQGLQQYCKGAYKIKDITVLRTMKDYIEILVQNKVPSMTYGYYEKNVFLTVTTDGILQPETLEKDNATTSASTTEVIKNRTCSMVKGGAYRIEEDFDHLFKTEMILMAKEMDTHRTIRARIFLF